MIMIMIMIMPTIACPELSTSLAVPCQVMMGFMSMLVIQLTVVIIMEHWPNHFMCTALHENMRIFS
jgi:hypothetical protein